MTTGSTSRTLAGAAAALVVVLAVCGIAIWLAVRGDRRIDELSDRVADLTQRVEHAESRADRAERESEAARQESRQARRRELDASSDARSARREAELAEERSRFAQQEREAAITARLEAERREAEALEREAEALAEATTAYQEATEARREADQARAESAELRRRRERELSRLEGALGQLAETRRTALGLVMNLGNSVEFDTDRADLRPENRELLARIAGVLATAGDYHIQIFGHTDDVGTEEYNRGLSERRAQAVADFLVESGVDAAVISASGLGKTQPLVEGTDEETRQRNRRVEIAVVSYNEEYVTPDPP